MLREFAWSQEELEAANAATRAALELQRQEDRADNNTPV